MRERDTERERDRQTERERDGGRKEREAHRQIDRQGGCFPFLVFAVL